MLRRLTGRLTTTRATYALGLAFALGATLLWFVDLILVLDTSVLRGPSDATNAIRQYWAMEAQGSNPFALEHDYLNGSPEGFPTPSAVQWAAPIQPSVIWGLHAAFGFGFTAAFNLFLLSGFVLTAFAMYVLLVRLRFGVVPALLGAYVVAFNPWTFSRAFDGHAGFVHGWVFVVTLAAALRLGRTRALRDAALLGAAWGLCFWMASYSGFFASLIVLVSYIVDFARQRELSERLWSFTMGVVTLAVVGVFLLPGLYAYVTNRETVNQSLDNPMEQLESRSASVWSYLVPSHEHPLLGSLARDLVETGLNERIVFFGWSTILLAAVAIVLLVRRRVHFGASQQTAILVAATLVPVAFVFSLPPTVELGPLGLPTPSAFIGEVTTFYRFYVRFGYIAGIGLALLAAATLAALMRRPYRLAVVPIAAVLAFELLPGPVRTWDEAAAPAHDVWLASQPNGAVAHYPMPTDNQQAIDLAHREFFYQRAHRKPLFTIFGAGFGLTREHAIRVLVRYVDDPVTPGVLAAEGVRYVVLHDDVYRSIGEAPPSLSEDFRLLMTFPTARVYELVAEPTDIAAALETNAAAIAQTQGLDAARAVYMRGFAAPERSSDGTVTREIEEQAIVGIDASETQARRFQATLFAESTTVAHDLEVIVGGTVVATAHVPAGARQSVVTSPFTAAGEGAPMVLRAQPVADSPGGRLSVSEIGLVPLADLTTSLRPS